MKWIALSFASLIVLFLGATFIDKYDENSCHQERYTVRAPKPGSDDPGIRDWRTQCGSGFLPW